MHRSVLADKTMARRGRLASRLGLVVVAASLGLTAGVSSIASASTTSKAKTPSLTTLEKSLTSLETTSSASLTETGSSLFYPLFSEWATAHPLGISISTTSASSGVGQSSAENGTANIGTSDSYLPQGTNAINIPVVVSSQEVMYNLPGLSKTHIKLNATVLSGIYSGQITAWNNPQIAALNKGVKLPSTPIVTLHRSGTSGDTFIFTYYIADQDPSSYVGGVDNVSTGTPFPNVPGALAESGNQGMETACAQTVGCIAYIGISYLREAVAAGLGYAALENGYKGKGGPRFTLPTPQNIQDELTSYKVVPANGTLSLIDSASAEYGYPIVNYEYAVVTTAQSNPSTGAAIKALLAWGMDPRHGAAESYLAPVHFLALPPVAMQVAINELKEIG